MENNPQIRSSDYLPEDLIAQILVNLPSKSVVKLIVVSKLWSSIIRSKSFIDLYLERSLTRPCLLFSFHRINRRFFHSISQEAISEEATPECSYTNTSSFPLSLDTRLPPLSYNVCTPVRGLICCQDLDDVVVSNPSTGQFLLLPKLNTKRKQISRFFGYDPIEDEYKVLCMTVLQVSYDYGPVVSEEHQVFTLGGTEKKKEETWRMITCKVPHCPATEGICIDGVVYYGAWSNSRRQKSLIMAFDVRTEEFTLVKLPDGVIHFSNDSELVNYQRQLALANYSYKGKFEWWVLEDVSKQEWSKISVVVPSCNDLVGRSLFYCRGAISSGEFVLTPSFSDGLICCQDLDDVVVSNPSTGQFLLLPKLNTKRKQISRFFGYDPIEDEYKVLCMTVLQLSYDYGPVVSEEHQVFTLGGAEKKKEATWRMITCKVPHCPATEGICIDGVVYYGACPNSKNRGSLIVGFDVRLEEFTLVKLPDGVEIYYDRDSELVNYQRKLALANLSYKEKFELLVLDKQEWSKISVMVPSLKDLVGQDLFYLRGAISSGEIIFTPLHSDWSSFIISYDRKEEIAGRVELKGIKDRSPYMRVFLNHVECPIFL